MRLCGNLVLATLLSTVVGQEMGKKDRRQRGRERNGSGAVIRPDPSRAGRRERIAARPVAVAAGGTDVALRRTPAARHRHDVLGRADTSLRGFGRLAEALPQHRASAPAAEIALRIRLPLPEFDETSTLALLKYLGCRHAPAVQTTSRLALAGGDAR
jgi:hypothetical protein